VREVTASTHVYLSPHLDDAALSCGGRIYTQTKAGERVQVVTVFGGVPSPGEALSPFAQDLHARWGHPPEAAARRQEEDLAAMALLGAEPVHWPYADCIYRRTADGRFPYAGEEALWASVDPAEEGLVSELTARLALSTARAGTIYAPLSIGNHVDHQIVRRMVESHPRPIVYYEDFPYAAEPQAARAALTRGDWEAKSVLLSEEAMMTKIDAIACYRSQLSTFWASFEEMAAMVRAYAEEVCGGRPAERYWRPSSI